MYSNYTEYLRTINNVAQSNFKSNPIYIDILDHVSFDLGCEYLKLIETEFPYITKEQIIEFLNINDKYGNPVKYNFNNDKINGNATSIRYIYHALLILNYYKNTNSTEIVELGCGYGGLFLALCFYSKILNIKINKYYFIDFPEACNLIKNYISLNKNVFDGIDYEIHNSNTYGQNISNNNLFFVSNYCFTEIENEHRKKYIEYLLPKCNNGFIVWQTLFRYKINNAESMFKMFK